MNINSENKDAYPCNLFAGGNSPPANPSGYNGSPLAAFQMVEELIQVVATEVSSTTIRSHIYSKLINLLFNQGWSGELDVEGLDPVFDEAIETIFNDAVKIKTKLQPQQP